MTRRLMQNRLSIFEGRAALLNVRRRLRGGCNHSRHEIPVKPVYILILPASVFVN